MRILLLQIIVLILVTSCASKHKNYKISNDKYDALRHESLYRYDANRLSKFAPDNSLALCHNGQFKKAEDLFVSELDIRKDEASYWMEVGTCYYLKGEYPKAKFYYQMALGLNPSKELQSAIINNLGLIYLRKLKYDEAKEHFQKASNLSPTALTPRYNLVQVFLYFGHYHNAEKNLTQLYRLNPNDVDFIYLLGHTKLMQNQYKKAELYFNAIPQEYLRRQDMANNLAMLYIKLSQFRKADKVLHAGDRTGSLKTLNAYVELEKVIARNYDKGYDEELK